MTAEMVLHDGDLEKIEDITPQNDKEGLPISDNVIIFNSKNEKVFSFNRNRSDGIPFNVIEFSESENTYRQGPTSNHLVSNCSWTTVCCYKWFFLHPSGLEPTVFNSNSDEWS